MRKVINIIVGFLFGISPLAGATIIGFVIYDSLPNYLGIIILGLIGLPTIWIGLEIFKRVQIVGPIDFITAVHASPDLDRLEPTQDSGTKRRKPSELVELLGKKENLLKGGAIKIYGDWFGKPHDNYHEIDSADFDSPLNILTMRFKDGVKLEIYNPEHIFEASTFLKIIHADRIKLSWFYFGKPQIEEQQFFLDYQKENKKIKTETNVEWYKPIFDVSLGATALIILGTHKK